MSRLGDLGHALYRGEVSYEFVGRRKRWYLISAGILVVAIAALLIRGLHLGVDFNGLAESAGIMASRNGSATVAPIAPRTNVRRERCFFVMIMASPYLILQQL